MKGISRKVMTKLEKKIKALKDYFSKRPEIIMAFVFGSYAKGRGMKESDFDIAVYFKPEGKSIEWEKDKEYPGENQIWQDVEKIVGIDTDLVVLNRASSTLSFAVIQEGVPIIIKDHSLYMRFYLIVSSAAEYFREFVKDFWEIKQRAMSLSEIDKEAAEKLSKFAKLRNILAHEYLDVRFRQIKEFIREAEPFYKKVVAFVKGIL